MKAKANLPVKNASASAPQAVRKLRSTPAETGAQKQQRALATRADLVRAARSVFARDGFEYARLADIAAAAGRTRGAFYDHFEDKEDVFFAIFEDDLDHYRATVSPILAQLPQLEHRVDYLIDYLVTKSQDREKMLLALEFKIYAIRHPRRRKRLADLHAAMCQRAALPELEHWVLAVTPDGKPLTRSESLLLGSLMDGFALNRLFDPGTLDEAQTRRYLAAAIRETLHLPAAAAPRRRHTAA